MKKLKLVAIMLVSLFLSSTALAQSNFGVNINGSDVKDFLVENDRVLISNEVVKNSFGYDTAQTDDNFTLNKENTSITFDNKTMTATIGEKYVSLDSPIISKDSKTYLPLRVLSILDGDTVSWNPETSSVMVTDTADKAPLDLKIKVLAGPTAISVGKMIENTAFLGNNTNYNVEILNQPKLASASILSKEADIITVPTNMAAILYNKKGDYQVGGVMIWGNLYLAGTESINSISELKGKEIFLTGKGATPDILLQKTLKDNNIDPQKDITLTYLATPQELASYAISGKASISVIPEPILTKTMSKNKNIKIIHDFQAAWKKQYKTKVGYPQTVVLVKKDIVKSHPQIVDSFLYEFANNMNEIETDVNTAAILGEKLEIGLAAGILKTAIPRSNFHYNSGDSVKTEINNYLQALYDFNPAAVGGKLPDEGFIR